MRDIGVFIFFLCLCFPLALEWSGCGLCVSLLFICIDTHLALSCTIIDSLIFILLESAHAPRNSDSSHLSFWQHVDTARLGHSCLVHSIATTSFYTHRSIPLHDCTLTPTFPRSLAIIRTCIRRLSSIAASCFIIIGYCSEFPFV